MLKVWLCLRDRSDEEGEDKASIARAMREEGKTLQEIADALGYKSKSAVCKLIKRVEK